jgi:hypothetical protein
MIKHELLEEEGILVVTPHGPLQAADFVELAEIVDPYIAQHGRLKGLVIYVEHFPGWGNFAALLSHLRFVKDHHKKIDRVAAVTDDTVLSHLPAIASHFVSAEVKHFDYAHKDIALMWVANGRK